MKKNFLLFVKVSFRLYFTIVLISVLAGCADSKNTPASLADIEKTFRNIPDTIQTSCYWYWMSDNLSKDGVVKDLHAMKEAGINRAFIGIIGGQGVPYGTVKIFSDEWWEILHTALKTATDLDIEIGLFNSPGWSQSGGPWVKPEQSMRYLSSTELVLKGPQKFSGTLPVPSDDFQPVCVIAYRIPQNTVDVPVKLRVVTDPSTKNASQVVDMDEETGVVPGGKEITFTLESPVPVTVHNIIIKTLKQRTRASAEFFVREGKKYRSLRKFEIDRSNPNINVGFNPWAPIVISVPETTSSSYRLVVSGITMPGGIAEIELSGVPMIERYPEKSLAKMFQTPLPYWKDYLWETQPEVAEAALAIDPSGVIDITAYRSSDGTINWDIPEGIWKIMQAGMTFTGQKNGPSSPEGTGPETDKLSKKHIASHFDAYLGEIMRRIPAEDRRTWKVVVADSYETGGQNWTDGFVEEFTAKYGYSPLPYLPALNGHVVGSREISDRFLWDLRRLVADKVSYDYVGGLKEVSNKHGLTTWLENYGHWGFPGEFLQYGGQSDEIGGEFWSEGSLGDIENRAASSCAHIYGKKKVSAESFTCGGRAFSRHPSTLKPRGDRFFTEGINNTLLHVYIHQPDDRTPGINAPFGNEFNRHNTWFAYMDMFTDYLKRCNYMLQQGTYIADVAYFIGEDAPKMTGICDPPLPKGYSFDYINAEVIETRLSVKDGMLVLPDGMSYRILVLPKLEKMRPSVLRKIKELVEAGAVVLGQAPRYSPGLSGYPETDNEVRKLAAALWGEVDGVRVKSAIAGKGRILSGMDMQEALDLIGAVPDFRVPAEDPVLFIHRSLSDGEVYFISNQSEKTITINPEFRVEGRIPEFWNPVSGEVRTLKAYSQNNGVTSVPLIMEPYESQFIVFRKMSSGSGLQGIEENFPAGSLLTDISNDWEVTFETAGRGPRKPVLFSSLSDWTVSANDSIKYFSGTAVYRKTFEIKDISDGAIVLDLGSLTSMARVKVNGEDAGGAWTAPWRVDITKAARKGLNTIEISVVNNWMNRIIGDLQLPPDQRPTWYTVNPWKPDSPLQPSGLFGPVRLFSIL